MSMQGGQRNDTSGTPSADNPMKTWVQCELPTADGRPSGPALRECRTFQPRQEAEVLRLCPDASTGGSSLTDCAADGDGALHSPPAAVRQLPCRCQPRTCGRAAMACCRATAIGEDCNWKHDAVTP